MFKANNWNNRTRCEIYSKFTIKTPDWRCGAFIVNFKHISHLFLVLLLLTLNNQLFAGQKRKCKSKSSCTFLFKVYIIFKSTPMSLLNDVFVSSRVLWTWRAYVSVNFEILKILKTCLACLKLMKCFLDVLHYGALVNCWLCWIK